VERPLFQEVGFAFEQHLGGRHQTWEWEQTAFSCLVFGLAESFPRVISRLVEKPVMLAGGKLMIQTVINILPKEASLQL
jgi:hypothetical protein